MVCMGFTCILQTNPFLVGRYWDFKYTKKQSGFTSHANFWLFQFSSKLKYDVKNIDIWGYSFLTEKKTLWEKKKLLVTSNFLFSHNVFKSCVFLMCLNEYLWSKGLSSLLEAVRWMSATLF